MGGEEDDMDMNLDSRIGGLVIFLAAAISVLSMAKPAAAQQDTDHLVGKWFQSYDYIPTADRPEGGAEWATGKTGRVSALLDGSLYFIAFDDHPGEVTMSVYNFQNWRFFPTKAALSEFVAAESGEEE